MRLWADEVAIDLGDEQRFMGALAQGNVLVVDGDTVTRCSRVTLGPDQIQGRVERATIRVKAPGARLDPRGIPEGRDASIFQGTFNRDQRDHFVIEDGEYTLCDCPRGAPPSWKLTSHAIDVTLGERATIWWPVFWVSPLGLFSMPITPPLPPISVPLTARAAGFLPPKLAFYDGYRPMIDLPFFWPIGDSWDLTLTPGLRTDWGIGHASPATWGAPRAGLRLRHAADPTTEGELAAQYTYDGAGGAARVFRKARFELVGLASGLPGERVSRLCHGTALPTTDAELAAAAQCPAILERATELESLVHRVQLTLRQSWRPSDSARLLVHGEWLSDDNIPSDFGVGLAQTVRDYVASRATLAFVQPGLWGLVGADYLLHLGGEAAANLDRAELTRAQRGPIVRLEILPIHLLEGVHLAGGASAVRFGPYGAGGADSEWVLGGNLGAALLRPLGALRLRAEARGELLHIDGPHNGKVTVALARTALEASTLVAGRIGELRHTIEPRLTYRALPFGQHVAGQTGGVKDSRLDERLAVAAFQQIQAGLRQQLWSDAAGRGVPTVLLDLTQPFDLVREKVAPLAIELSLSWSAVSLSAWGAVRWPESSDVDAVGRAPAGAFEDLGGWLALSWRGWALSLGYTRSSPTADRFNRGIDELASTGALSPPTPTWVHQASAQLSVTHPWGRLSFAPSLLLPRPDEPSAQSTGDVTRPVGVSRPYFNEYRLDFTYTSPCNCWGVTTGLVVQPPGHSFDFLGVQIAVGDFRLGV